MLKKGKYIWRILEKENLKVVSHFSQQCELTFRKHFRLKLRKFLRNFEPALESVLLKKIKPKYTKLNVCT